MAINHNYISICLHIKTLALQEELPRLLEYFTPNIHKSGYKTYNTRYFTDQFVSVYLVVARVTVNINTIVTWMVHIVSIVNRMTDGPLFIVSTAEVHSYNTLV